jgi:hypothetical protein
MRGEVMEQIRVSIEGNPYSVIGGAFWDMLAQVKTIPGRTMGAQKVWSLPVALAEARAALAPLQIVDEDGLLDAEIADIQRVQARLLELRQPIERRIHDLYDELSRYSRNSKSSIRAGKAVEYGRLGHALDYAQLMIEALTEPQIKTMYAALRDMEEE